MDYKDLSIAELKMIIEKYKGSREVKIYRGLFLTGWFISIVAGIITLIISLIYWLNIPKTIALIILSFYLIAVFIIILTIHYGNKIHEYLKINKEIRIRELKKLREKKVTYR